MLRRSQLEKFSVSINGVTHSAIPLFLCCTLTAHCDILCFSFLWNCFFFLVDPCLLYHLQRCPFFCLGIPAFPARLFSCGAASGRAWPGLCNNSPMDAMPREPDIPGALTRIVVCLLSYISYKNLVILVKTPAYTYGSCVFLELDLIYVHVFLYVCKNIYIYVRVKTK